MSHRLKVTAACMGVLNTVAMAGAVWGAYKIGKAIDAAWDDAADANYMLLSCSGRDPKGWDRP